MSIPLSFFVPSRSDDATDGTAFFANSGIKDPFLTQIATSIVNVFMTLPGMWGIERFGRRSLLIWGAVAMCICEYLVAIIGVTISVTNTSGQKALVALVCIYIAAFASTWGPIAWVVTGEIFPLNVRAKAMSLACASNWLWNFAIGYATPYLVNVAPGSAGLQSKVFFIWGSTCACCIVFSFFCIPEVRSSRLLMFNRRLLTRAFSPDQGTVARADRPPLPELDTTHLHTLPQGAPRLATRPQGLQRRRQACRREGGGFRKGVTRSFPSAIFYMMTSRVALRSACDVAAVYDRFTLFSSLPWWRAAAAHTV